VPLKISRKIKSKPSPSTATLRVLTPSSLPPQVSHICTQIIDKCVDFIAEQAMKPRGGVEVQLYSFFNLGDRRKVVVKATPRPLYPSA